MECQSDFSTSTDEGVAFANNVTWMKAKVESGGQQIDVISNRQPGETFGIGHHTITYTATDGHSFSVECTFTIIIYG